MRQKKDGHSKTSWVMCRLDCGSPGGVKKKPCKNSGTPWGGGEFVVQYFGNYFVHTQGNPDSNALRITLSIHKIFSKVLVMTHKIFFSDLIY